MIGRYVHFDFSGPPPPADWLVHGLIERGTITVLSADSGVGKSLICKSIIVCGLQGRPWAGHKTYFKRAMVIDEENFLRVIWGRFSGFGMTNADRNNLRYFLRCGVSLGEEDWVERTLEELDEFKPDLLVIDTAAAATAVDVNDNNGVANLYKIALRPLAEKAGVVLLHHERKPQQGSKRNAGHAMMGARQWAGQADAHIALEMVSNGVQIEPLPDGVRKRLVLNMEVPKNRDGSGNGEKIVLVSEHDHGTDHARKMWVEKVGR